MSRIGLYPPTGLTPDQAQALARSECTDDQGRMRVNRERCDTCPFIAKSWFNYQLKRILRDFTMLKEPIMQCHSTFPEDVDGAVCRGGYDHSLKEHIKNPVFIEQQKTSYVVTPFGD